MHIVLISAFGGRKSVDIPAASKARVEGVACLLGVQGLHTSCV